MIKGQASKDSGEKSLPPQKWREMRELKIVPELETERLRLRAFIPVDLEALHPILSNAEVVKHLGVKEGVPLTKDETEDILNSAITGWQRQGFSRWAVIDKVSGQLIGLCGFRSHEGMPELLYVLSKPWWNRGLASEAARACLRFGFEELKFKQIIAFTRRDNISSLRVLEKLGMSKAREAPEFGDKAVVCVLKRERFYVSDLTYYRYIT